MATEADMTPLQEFGHAAEEAGHAAVGLPQLDLGTYPSQIFWLIVAFLVLYWLMAKVALPRIAGVLEERADAVAADLDRAEELKRKAEEAEAAYKRALAEARASAQTIAAETRAEIQKEIDAAIAKADAEISARTAEGEKRIAEIRDSAMASVAQVAGETAVAIVDRLMPGIADDQTVRAAVDARLG